MNLALNAAAFASSSVILTAEEVPGGFAVRVTDDGPGISPSRSESIFQGDSTREGGTGIGLAHARSVLRARGGDLTLEPANAGPGACFVATFSAAIPSRAASAQGLDGLRVLVVEDDPAVSVLLETALDTRGAVPTMAPNLKALLAAQGPFDVVLLDLSPIAGNPIQATEHLKTLANPSSWILATGSSANIPKVLANAWMVEKPYEVSEIVAAVQAAAERVRKAT